jgi:hypothetical protein
MKLRQFLLIGASLLLVLSACGGGGGGGASQSGAGTPPPPPVQTLPKGISVLAGAIGGDGNADGPVGRLRNPKALAFDASGVLYVGDFGATVRTVTFGTGTEAVLGTRWRDASVLDGPEAMVADKAGNVIAILGKRIVRIAPSGTLTVLAGSGEEGHANGQGAAASFSLPRALAIDSAGLIWVADYQSVRTVTADGVVSTHAAATNALIDVAGEMYGQPFYVGQSPTGLAFDNAGNLLIATGSATTRRVTPSGARQDTSLPVGTAIAVARDGSTYVYGQCALYKADPAGQVSLLAGSPSRRGAVDGDGQQASFGNDYYCDGNIATDGAGNVFLADMVNNAVRKITPGGIVSTVAGKPQQRGMVDGTGTAARFTDGAHQLSFDGKDTLYMVQDKKVRKVTRAGVVTTLNLPEKDASQNPITYFTGGMAWQGSLVGVANRVVYLVEENGSMRALAGSPSSPRQTDGTGAQAGFDTICGVTRDGAGNFYLLDCYEHRAAPTDVFPDWVENRVRKVTPGGVVTTVYTAPHEDRAAQPWFLAADRQGNVFAVPTNNTVVRIAATGSATLIRGELPYQSLPAVDGSGKLFLASFVTLPSVVEQLGMDGKVQRIAGRSEQFGLITGALPGSLNLITGITVDDQGTIYVLTENAVVRIVQ